MREYRASKREMTVVGLLEVGGLVGVELVEILVRVGHVGTRSEARRLIRQGAVRVDGERVEDVRARVRLRPGGVVIRTGKRRWVRVLP